MQLPLEVLLEILAWLESTDDEVDQRNDGGFSLFSNCSGSSINSNSKKHNSYSDRGSTITSNRRISSTYRSLALVCRAWYEPAILRLYRNITIYGPHKAKLLARTLTSTGHETPQNGNRRYYFHDLKLGHLIHSLAIHDPQTSLASSLLNDHEDANFAYKKQPLSRDAVPSSIVSSILEETPRLEHLALQGKFVKKIDTSILSDRPLRSLSLDVDSDEGRRVDSDAFQYLPISLESLSVHCLAIPSDACVYLPNLKNLDMTIPARHLEHSASVFASSSTSCPRLEKLTIRKTRQDDGVTELLETLGHQLKTLEIIDPELEVEIATDCLLHTQNLETLTVIGGTHRRWVCVVPRTLSEFSWHVDGLEDNLADFLTMLINPGFLPHLKYIPSICPVMHEDNFGSWKMDVRKDALVALRSRGLQHPNGGNLPDNSLWTNLQ